MPFLINCRRPKPSAVDKKARAIRYNSGHHPLPTHFGVSASIAIARTCSILFTASVCRSSCHRENWNSFTPWPCYLAFVFLILSFHRPQLSITIRLPTVNCELIIPRPQIHPTRNQINLLLRQWWPVKRHASIFCSLFDSGRVTLYFSVISPIEA